MKEILLALDYGPHTQTTAETGYNVAKAFGAHVTLLHTIVDPAYYYSNEYSPILGFTGFSAQKFENQIEALKETAGDFLERVKQYLGDVSISTIVKQGDPANAILQAAKETQADLIIVASHGRKGLEKILIGSVTERLLHETTVPLFVIPIKEKE